MNAKFVVAVLVVLQVSQAWSLPTPSPEVVQKYDDMKAIFLKRMDVAINKIMNYFNEEQTAEAAAARQQKQAVVRQVVGSVREELAPALDQARYSVLSLYTAMRPYIGQYVVQAYDSIKPVLDEHLPSQAQ